MHVGEQGDAVPRFDIDVDLAEDAVLGLAQVAIVLAGGLRTIELALTRLGARDSSRGDLSNHGNVRANLLRWRGFMGELGPADNIDVGFTRT